MHKRVKNRPCTTHWINPPDIYALTRPVRRAYPSGIELAYLVQRNLPIVNDPSTSRASLLYKGYARKIDGCFTRHSSYSLELSEFFIRPVAILVVGLADTHRFLGFGQFLC